MDIDYSPCFSLRDVENVWSIIKNSIMDAMPLFIPKVKLRSHQYPPWMKSGLCHELNCLRSKKRKFKSTGNKQGLEHIQRANQSFHQNYITAKSEYQSKLINDFAFSSNSKMYGYSEL